MTQLGCKEIADGLMRAKQLEILNLNNAQGFECSQIIYNLAFSPKIRIINARGAKLGTDPIVEAFYKLLKISGSIETLLLGNSDFATKISTDFCTAIGENKTLVHLDVSALAAFT